MGGGPGEREGTLAQAADTQGASFISMAAGSLFLL